MGLPCPRLGVHPNECADLFRGGVREIPTRHSNLYHWHAVVRRAAHWNDSRRTRFYVLSVRLHVLEEAGLVIVADGASHAVFPVAVRSARLHPSLLHPLYASPVLRLWTLPRCAHICLFLLVGDELVLTKHTFSPVTTLGLKPKA